MSIIPLTWRSSVVRTNVWKCFLAIFFCFKEEFVWIWDLCTAKGTMIFGGLDKTTHGECSIFFFCFVFFFSPHWNYNSLRNISEICEKIFWKICQSSDVKILMNCNIVQNRKHLFFGGMKDCWMKTWMIFFFSELKNIHRLILQLEIKIGKAMLSEAPTQHSFHHTDSIKVCKQIKEVSFGM